MSLALGAGVISASAFEPWTVDFSTPEWQYGQPGFGFDEDGEYRPWSVSSYWYVRGDEEENNSVIKDNLLYVKAGNSTLFRTVDQLAESTGPKPRGGLEVPDSGLYVDTRVKLCVYEEMPDLEEFLLTGDKLQIALVSDAENPRVTNVVVTAGVVDADGLAYDAANYVVTNKLEAGVWYRLTARYIANAATRSDVDPIPAFEIRVDGVPLACEEVFYRETVGAGAETYLQGGVLFETCALFPIAQNDAFSPYRFYAVGGSGETQFGNITVTNASPFAAATNAIDLVVLCEDAALTRLDYAAATNGIAYASGSLASGINGFRLPVYPGAEVVFTPTAAPRAAIDDELHFTGNLAALGAADGYTVRMVAGETFASGEELTVTFVSDVAYFDVGGERYARLADAIAAADDLGKSGGSNVLRLMADLTLARSAAADNGQARILAEQDVVIDLCGHRIKGDHYRREAAIYDQGRLEIIDSVGGGLVEAPGTVLEIDGSAPAGEDVSDNDALELNHDLASLTLGRETVTNLFTVHGRVRVSNENATLVIKVGDYLTPHGIASPEKAFYLADYLSPRSETNCVVVAGTGTYWRVTFDGTFLVSYVTEHGAIDPPTTNVTGGATLVEPTLDAPGYHLAKWRDEATGLDWTFGPDGSAVSNDVTIRAVLALDAPYTIAYDVEVAGNPATYTVEAPDPMQTLLGPTSNLFTFAGWADANHGGQIVTAVGKDATFTDSDRPVSGDLDLRATWRPEALLWSNTQEGLAESNGTYKGSWQLTIPETDLLHAGRKVKISEIDLCIVNPLLYPKTAPRLAVKTGDSAPVVSLVRTNYLNAATGVYEVSSNVLANGRARVAYRFENLELAPGVSNELYFAADEAGAVRKLGFLRLGLGQGVEIGNCTEAGGDLEPSNVYTNYCPIYEIHGEVVP